MMLTKPKSVLAIAIASSTLLNSALGAEGDSWPFYRGPLGDGTTPAVIGQTKWGKAGPKSVWKAPTENGFSSFCISEGMAFTLVTRSIDGVPTEVCVALDAATGVEKWAAPMSIAKYRGGGDDGEGDNKGGDGPRTTPTYADGHLFVLGANLDLYCLSATDGSVKWKKDILTEHAGKNVSWSNAASPLVVDGIVYAAGGGTGQALLAFKASTGDVVWKTADDAITHATPVYTKLHDTPQVIFFTQVGLVSTAPKTGAILWRFDFPFRVSTAASPVVYQDMVYCAAGYGVGMACAKITKDGETWKADQLWRTEGQDVTNHWSTPVMKDGYLYGMFSFKKYGKGPLLCLDMKTGEVKWKEDGYGAGNTILAGNQLLALSDRGELAIVDANPKAYKEIARADVLDGKCWSTPVLAGGKVYARSTKEAICLDVAEK